MHNPWAIPVAVIVVGLLGACDQPTANNRDGTDQVTTASGSAEAPMSPSDLPTLATPSAPPTRPTDTLPDAVVAGRVAVASGSCTEVTTDDGVTWSLSGDAGVALAVGDTVRVKVAELEVGEEPCGPGEAARIVSLTVVG